jgi:hypothetical protein
MRVKLVFGIFIFIGIFVAFNQLESSEKVPTPASIEEKAAEAQYLKRIEGSLSDENTDYKPKDCYSLVYVDGSTTTFCTANFSGNTTGLYDVERNIIAVKNFDKYTVSHELFHAVTMHYNKKGIRNFGESDIQEKMAYDFEYLLAQIDKI